MKILIVNLDKRYDRWKNVIYQIQKSNFIKTNYTRYSAQDGFLLSDHTIKSLVTQKAYQDIIDNKPTKGLYLSRGAVGLAKTYYDILTQCDQTTLILEDDIIISDNFDNGLFKSIKDLPEDWDILYIGWYKSSNLKTSILTPNIARIGGQINGTQAWMINPRSAKKILDIFPLSYQIDTEIYKHKNLNKYCTITPLITRLNSKSDIQTY
jgi:GR25 family glycosyltransferase involved in LPS biosynthesis